MRKLKLQVQMSLDGFVAGPNGELDWIFIDQDLAILDRVNELADTCDTILLGRKMTPGFIEHWENMLDNQPENPEHGLARRMVSMRKIVFSRTIKTMKGRNLEVENGDFVKVIKALKEQPGKDIIVYGGATFVSSLIQENLIDEYVIFKRRIAIGTGLSIFKERRMMKVESSTTYKNGTVLMRYLPE